MALFVVASATTEPVVTTALTAVMVPASLCVTVYAIPLSAFEQVMDPDDHDALDAPVTVEVTKVGVVAENVVEIVRPLMYAV